ncbi:formimidoylglutamase [Mesobacillus maritimus]|uniref:Formimidoylglutamase n=1 Tax=Mesobacillus maritimus TaxID=1643336 RepID=A0ABS7K4S2_9BACI|nr:formimidoylglutamase [Mesobacillus maritimus]MBY0097141.1 formimidoylglutamase [Mesobacillus maritimus]
MYIHPSEKNWRGRIDSVADPLSFRYHQNVRLAELTNLAIDKSATQSFGILGFRCDEGVKRNNGRSGAEDAPDKIKMALAKLPWHLSAEANLYDVGNIKCEEGRMEEAQQELGKAVAKLFEKKVIPIILGGGHETAYGHYLGVRESIGPEAKLGIINIDAHFDMRPYDEQSSSGTMFKQILDSDPNTNYFVAGIQPAGNTLSLFDTAKKHRVPYLLEEELTLGDMELIQGQICAFAARQDYIMLTLCTDSISSAYAPGVSAPSPFGLEPKTVRSLIRYIVSSKKLLSFDLSEVNPLCDENNKTVTLAAHLIHDAMMNFHSK